MGVAGVIVCERLVVRLMTGCLDMRGSPYITVDLIAEVFASLGFADLADWLASSFGVLAGLALTHGLVRGV